LLIDGHIHAGYWSPGRFLGRGVPFAELERCLEECSLDGAVLTTTDLRDNEAVAAFVSAPRSKRYWFFPWVNPARPDDLEFLKRRRRDIHGIKFHPSCDLVKVTDDRARPFLSFAADQGLPVIVHCGRWQEMSSYAFALEVAGRHQGVNFVLSHMGGDTPELETATIEKTCASGLRNVFLGIEGVREYWAVQLAVERMGADKVIFGSDYPLGHPRMYLGLVDALRLTEGERAAVLGGNILGLLGETSR
jgi:predicted TIM-barrel fold metal-dependent hydrolase